MISTNLMSIFVDLDAEIPSQTSRHGDALGGRCPGEYASLTSKAGVFQEQRFGSIDLFLRQQQDSTVVVQEVF